MTKRLGREEPPRNEPLREGGSFRAGTGKELLPLPCRQVEACHLGLVEYAAGHRFPPGFHILPQIFPNRAPEIVRMCVGLSPFPRKHSLFKEAIIKPPSDTPSGFKPI